jgi:putative transposase
MELNTFGKITNDCWLDLLNHYQNCWLDEFVIMPDHVHGIVKIKDNTNSELTRSPSVGNGLKPFPTEKTMKIHGLSEIIRGFKTFSSRRINEQHPDSLFRWQKSFYDRIIRNENEFYAIRNYIINNPRNWTPNTKIFTD